MIISETIQAMHITFAVEIVRLKVYIWPLPMTLTDMSLKLYYYLTCNISDNIYAITFKLGMTVDLNMAYMLMLVSNHLGLDARSQWVGKGKTISVDWFRQLSKQQALNLLQW